MPLTRAAQQDREADTVRSRPTRAGYWCPSRDAVLGHLAAVHMHLQNPRLTPEKRAVLDEDLDALLGRLSWHLAVDSATEVTKVGKR